MNSRRQRSIPLGGRYRQVSLYFDKHRINNAMPLAAVILLVSIGAEKYQDTNIFVTSLNHCHGRKQRLLQMRYEIHSTLILSCNYVIQIKQTFFFLQTVKLNGLLIDGATAIYDMAKCPVLQGVNNSIKLCSILKSLSRSLWILWRLDRFVLSCLCRHRLLMENSN